MTQQRGTLAVVGTGIQVGHWTIQARRWIESADKVVYCVGDSASEHLIRQLNPTAESLYTFYGNGKPRIDTYNQMVERTLECVRQGLKVCMAFYGHPGIFVYPSHEAIRRARLEGHRAFMLPAVSSIDCLFADLGIDPVVGCQMVEATSLLIRKVRLDTGVYVIVWQGAAVGDLGFNFAGFDGRNVPVLRDILVSIYGPEFECTIYEAAQYPVCDPVIKKVRLDELANSHLTGISTICLAPRAHAPIDAEMVQRLGIQGAVRAKMAATA